MRSRAKAAIRFPRRDFAYASWPPSCWMLKPTPATARLSDTAAGSACHHTSAQNTSANQDRTSQATITAVLNQRRAPPVVLRPVSAK